MWQWTILKPIIWCILRGADVTFFPPCRRHDMPPNGCLWASRALFLLSEIKKKLREEFYYLLWLEQELVLVAIQRWQEALQNSSPFQHKGVLDQTNLQVKSNCRERGPSNTVALTHSSQRRVKSFNLTLSNVGTILNPLTLPTPHVNCTHFLIYFAITSSDIWKFC